MEHDFWRGRWARNNIAFHEGKPNGLLRRHHGRFGLAADARVFVPLCGKTRDIAWLVDSGYRVVGSELVEDAVRQLFDEMESVPEVTDAPPFKVYRAGAVEVFVGDHFQLAADVLGAVDAVYDRAALVALPDGMRGDYARHMGTVSGFAPQLLLTFEYDQAAMDGPPFSLDEADVRQLYAGTYTVDRVETVEVRGGLKGKVAATASAWLLTPK